MLAHEIKTYRITKWTPLEIKQAALYAFNLPSNDLYYLGDEAHKVRRVWDDLLLGQMELGQKLEHTHGKLLSLDNTNIRAGCLSSQAGHLLYEPTVAACPLVQLADDLSFSAQ
jgi:hypothetical protein